MADYIYLGAQAPEALSVEVTSDDIVDLDLTSVTAVSLAVNKPGMEWNDETSWPVAIDTQTTTVLSVHHDFAVADVDTLGAYRVMIVMSVPTGIRRAGPIYFEGIY